MCQGEGKNQQECNRKKIKGREAKINDRETLIEKIGEKHDQKERKHNEERNRTTQIGPPKTPTERGAQTESHPHRFTQTGKSMKGHILKG